MALVNGYVEDELAVHARYADLLVVGQTDPDAVSLTPTDLPETVALSAGRPTLVVPHIGVRSKPGGTVMLCWNASRESARAATDALPFLIAAEKVIVLVVDPRSSGAGTVPSRAPTLRRGSSGTASRSRSSATWRPMPISAA